MLETEFAGNSPKVLKLQVRQLYWMYIKVRQLQVQRHNLRRTKLFEVTDLCLYCCARISPVIMSILGIQLSNWWAESGPRSFIDLVTDVCICIWEYAFEDNWSSFNYWPCVKKQKKKTIMVISGKWDQLGLTPLALHVSAHTCSLWRTHLKQAPADAAVLNVY